MWVKVETTIADNIIILLWEVSLSYLGFSHRTHHSMFSCLYRHTLGKFIYERRTMISSVVSDNNSTPIPI